MCSTKIGALSCRISGGIVKVVRLLATSELGYFYIRNPLKSFLLHQGAGRFGFGGRRGGRKKRR